jgi:hypothetical protein
MPALAHRRHDGAPLVPAARPRLRAVSAPRPSRASPAAATACYALGLAAGFLLAAAASAPGGAGVVSVQLLLAGAAALVAGLAALRARAVARRARGAGGGRV